MNKQDGVFSKDSLPEHIRTNIFFSRISDSTIQDLLPHMESVHLREGETLIRQNDISDAIYFVVEGQLEAIDVHPDGKAVPLGKIYPGEPIGEIQILTGGTHTASVRTLSDASLVKLSRRVLEDVMEKSPELIHALAGISRKRLLHNQLLDALPKLFGSLDDAMLHDIEANVEWLHIQSGEPLFREGDPADALYIVLYGRLRAVTGKGGRSERILGEVGMGESVGEMSLFTDEPRSATVFAVRESELVKISRAVFERIIRQHPQLAMEMTKLLIGRLRAHNVCSSSLKTVKNIAVIPASRNVPLDAFTSRTVSSLSPFGPVLHLSSAHVDELLSAPGIAASPDGSTGSMRLLSWLNEQEMKHAFVLFEADLEVTPWTRRCLQQADHILLAADASRSPQDGMENPLLMLSEKYFIQTRRSLVLLHTDGRNMPSGTRRWLDRYKVDDHYHIRWDRDADFLRLGRFIAGKTTSLVLSGGGARGLAHIGIIRALRDMGIPIDMVGGASMGAVIASGCAMDLDDDAMYQRALTSFIQRSPFSDFTLPFISLVRCRELDSIIREGVGDIHIEDLWISYFCVSSNLSTAELVIHRRGSLWKAMRASVSYPGIAVPVVEGSHLLVDGGVLNNLPIDIMRESCNGRVIAADVSGEEDLTVTGDMIPSPWRVFLSRLLPFMPAIRIPNIFDVLMRTAVLSSIQRRNQVMQDADLYLKPPVHNYGLLDFKAIDSLIEIGYRYTREKLGH